jgi:predicted amidohydrolase
MTQPILNVAGLQLDLAWEDAPANRALAGREVRAAAAAGARLVVLPEMFATAYSMRAEAMARHAEATLEFLAHTAREAGVWLLGGLAVPGDAVDSRPLNRAALFNPLGELALSYDKIHPFSLAGEHLHYAAGEHLPTIEVEGLRVTVLICYDLRFPELFRARAADTDLFVVIANWPERRRHHWSSLLVARAIENQAYVLGVNRVGDGDGLHYTGDSAFIDPLGLVHGAEPGSPARIVGGVSAQLVLEVREKFGFLSDRRPDVYRGL